MGNIGLGELRTERSVVRTKTADQIFIKTARASKVSRWFIIKHSDQTCIFEFAGVRKQKYTAYAVRIAKLRPSKNQSEHSDLPQDYQTK